jgi:hypothetical protein
MKAYLFISQEQLRRHWMVEILRGEFTKSQEPSDPAKEKEGLQSVSL